MNNLKPCPFCGGEAELCYSPGLGTDSCRGYTLYASCNECSAKSPGLWQEKKPKPNDQSWKDAADDWNSRPGEEELKQLWSSNLDIINGELNKQLAEARAEIERLALEIENKQYTITCASEENQQLKESLAEARAEIENLQWQKAKCAKNKTPRTDEQILHHDNGNGHPSAFVFASFARELEEELTEARARVNHLSRIVIKMTEEQAMLCAEGQSITELVATKDKLIEQMREALKAIDGIGREAGNARREDALRCFAIAAAALAAERGE